MRNFFFLLTIVLVVFACTDTQENEKRVEGVVVEDPNSVSAMIRNPITLDDKNIDTSSLAKMTFQN